MLAIVGPTASGKTALSIKLALRFSGEIISADSRQVYEGFDATSAKASPVERGGVPHHLLSVVPITYRYSVIDFVRDAKKAITNIHSRGNTPILAGGTMHYIDALLFGQEFPEVPPNEKLREELSHYSSEKLFIILKEKDPRRAETIEQKNPRRLIRALEIVDALGAVPDHTLQYEKPQFSFKLFGIEKTLDTLEKCIKKRNAKRLEALIREITKAVSEGILTEKRASELGFDFLLGYQYVKGALSKDTLETTLNTKDRQYAIRQMRWLKRNPHIHWLKSDDVFEEVCEVLRMS